MLTKGRSGTSRVSARPLVRTVPTDSRSNSSTSRCPLCWASFDGKAPSWRNSGPIPPRSKTCSFRSLAGICAMSETRRWSEYPLVQLTRVRYREFFREPEAVFWVFIFPVLLAAGLGIAFRNRAPEQTSVAVVAGDPAAAKTADALRNTKEVQVSLVSDSAAAEALRTGEVAV